MTKGIIFNPIIRYGDSVIGDTPLLLRNSTTKDIFFEKINFLSNSYENYHRKESSELDNIETWTENGWTKVHD